MKTHDSITCTLIPLTLRLPLSQGDKGQRGLDGTDGRKVSRTSCEQCSWCLLLVLKHVSLVFLVRENLVSLDFLAVKDLQERT